MSESGATWEDAGFKKALKAYLDLKKNVNPKVELRRRAKNIGMKLIRIYKEKGTKAQEIGSAVDAVGHNLKIRKSIRAKGKASKWTWKQMQALEKKARKAATGFTATGWFPAVEKLGGSPKDKKKRKGPKRGKLVERLFGFEMSETLINNQPGAEVVATKAETAVQQAMNQETEDMLAYIAKKQNEAAKRNGL